MKYENVKKYAVEAFRFYARNSDIDAFKKQIRDMAYEMGGQNELNVQHGVSSSVESAVLRAELAVKTAQPEIDDLVAVKNTFTLLGRQSGSDITRALQIVYMSNPGRKLEKGDIYANVIRATQAVYVSERTIYGWMSLAVKVFAKERGLRLEE